VKLSMLSASSWEGHVMGTEALLIVVTGDLKQGMRRSSMPPRISRQPSGRSPDSRRTVISRY